MSNARSLPNLPKSDDAFWDKAEVYTGHPVNIPICPTHKKDNWLTHEGYIDNGDGTISCQFCPFGAKINSGFYRVVGGRIVDLRDSVSRHA